MTTAGSGARDVRSREVRSTTGPAEHHVSGRKHRRPHRALPGERGRDLRLGGARLAHRTGCYGICVPDAPQTGCQIDTDCPMGQQCNVACREWACIPGGTGTGTPTNTDPATGATAPPGAACACDAVDNSCSCDASGACKGRTCAGQCAPKPPTCDPAKPVDCPTFGRSARTASRRSGTASIRTPAARRTPARSATGPPCRRRARPASARRHRMQVRASGRHRSGELLPEVRVRRRSRPTAPAGSADPLPTSPRLRGEGIDCHPPS